VVDRPSVIAARCCKEIVTSISCAGGKRTSEPGLGMCVVGRDEMFRQSGLLPHGDDGGVAWESAPMTAACCWNRMALLLQDLELVRADPAGGWLIFRYGRGRCNG
jgi:hypothetical protein